MGQWLVCQYRDVDLLGKDLGMRERDRGRGRERERGGVIMRHKN